MLSGMAPASLALFSIRQGMRSLLPRNSSCPLALFLILAGSEKLLALGWLLPHKLYSHSGRSQEAKRLHNTPAPQALFPFRQGYALFTQPAAPLLTTQKARARDRTCDHSPGLPVHPHHTFASLPSIRQVAAAQATARTATTFIIGLPPRLSLRRAIT